MTQASRLIVSVLLVFLSTSAFAQQSLNPIENNSYAPILIECYQANIGIKNTGALANFRECIGTAAQPCLDDERTKSTVDMSDCISNEIDIWDQFLNQYYAELKLLMTDKKFGKLRDVQRSWISYRDKKCKFPYEFWEGGTMAVPMTGWCLMDTTALRAIELAQWLDQFQNH